MWKMENDKEQERIEIMKKKMSKILLVLLTSIFVTGCSLDLKSDKPIENGMIQENVQLNDIPEFSNEPYTVLNGNDVSI